MKKRQYRSNQGRSPEKQEEIYQVLQVAFIVFFFAIILGMLICK